MMNDPGKPVSLRATKTRKARLRRLKILRMRSAGRPPRSGSDSSKMETDASSNSLNGDRTSSTSSIESSEVGRREGRDGGGGSHGKGSEGSSGCKSSGLLYGHVSVMGRRRVMEDAVTVAPLGWLAGEYSFFAVYDGHGGAKVAEKCRDRMHKSLERLVDKAKTVPDQGRGFIWEKVMAECFSSMDRELLEEDVTGGDATQSGGGDKTGEVERMVGSTAVVVVVGREELVVANCGDSRAILCRSGAAIPLSRDHKPQPDRADEKERIEAAGGRVLNWNGWRVQGVLATSRSLGDHCLKPYVTSEPEVTVLERSKTDDFLIIATDGLFDVVGNELACELVKKYLNNRQGSSEAAAGASEAAVALAELALAKGSKDNISVIVVQLN